MKEITFPAPRAKKTTVEFANLLKKDSPLIGVLTEDGHKVTLIPANYCSDLYLARCVRGWEKGNNYSPDRKNAQTIKDWCEFFHKSHKAKMFLFDTPQELFAWLAK
jgi:hypothetical protein